MDYKKGNPTKNLHLNEILTIKGKMEDYLDYLYIQKVKAQTTKRYSLAEVKRELGMGA